MLKRFIALPISCSVFFPFSALPHNLNTEIFVHTQSFTYSEVAPIKQFAESLQGPALEGGNRAFTSNSMKMGQRVALPRFGGTMEYAIVSRLDYSLRFTHDTAKLFYAKENNVPLAEERVHDVFLRANHIRANGIQLGYIGRWSDPIEYRIHLTYLNAEDMLYGQIEGDLTTLENDAQGTLDLDYFYSEDVFFEREPSHLRGHGFTLDIAATWSITPKATVHVAAKDIVSRIIWDQQHQTIANTSSDRVSRNEQGTSRVRPLLSWRETSSTVKQNLPRQFSLFGRYQFDDTHALTAEHFVYDNHDFQRIGYRYQFNPRYHVSTFYDLTAEAYSIEAGSPYLTFGLHTDNTDIEEAKLFGVFLTLKAPLQF